MPQAEAQGDRLVEAAHVGPHPLAHRFQRRPAVALLRNVPADDVRGAVVDGREEPAPALRTGPEHDASVPQSWSGLTVRISSTSSSSLRAVFGPRFPGSRRSATGDPPSLARTA